MREHGNENEGCRITKTPQKRRNFLKIAGASAAGSVAMTGAASAQPDQGGQVAAQDGLPPGEVEEFLNLIREALIDQGELDLDIDLVSLLGAVLDEFVLPIHLDFETPLLGNDVEVGIEEAGRVHPPCHGAPAVRKVDVSYNVYREFSFFDRTLDLDLDFWFGLGDDDQLWAGIENLEECTAIREVEFIPNPDAPNRDTADRLVEIGTELIDFIGDIRDAAGEGDDGDMDSPFNIRRALLIAAAAVGIFVFIRRRRD